MLARVREKDIQTIGGHLPGRIPIVPHSVQNDGATLGQNRADDQRQEGDQAQHGHAGCHPFSPR